MPHTVTIEREVYRFDELSPAAKERARDWWRAGEAQDSVPWRAPGNGVLA